MQQLDGTTSSNGCQHDTQQSAMPASHNYVVHGLALKPLVVPATTLARLSTCHAPTQQGSFEYDVVIRSSCYIYLSQGCSLFCKHIVSQLAWHSVTVTLSGT